MSFKHKLIHKIAHQFLKVYNNYFYGLYRNKYKIHDDFLFNGFDIRFIGDGEIICDGNSYVGLGSRFSSNKGNSIQIGKNCAISHNVRIYTGTYDSNFDFNSSTHIPEKYNNVLIGDGVWIGLNVVILPGVVIGNNTVIGANSVVSKSIPENSIASGIPCKVIREKKSVY